MTPNPSTPTWTSLALGCVSSSSQTPLALLAFVAAQLAQVGERMHDHPLAHAIGEIGIYHACDRPIWESGIGEEMIHAGPERENDPKVRKVFERAGGMAPT